MLMPILELSVGNVNAAEGATESGCLCGLRLCGGRMNDEEGDVGEINNDEASELDVDDDVDNGGVDPGLVPAR